MNKFWCLACGGMERIITKPELVSILDGDCEIDSWVECDRCQLPGAKRCAKCSAKKDWDLHKAASSQRFARYLGFERDKYSKLQEVSKQFQGNGLCVASVADSANFAIK